MVSNVEDARSRYITSDLGLSYHSLSAMNAKQVEEVIEMEVSVSHFLPPIVFYLLPTMSIICYPPSTTRHRPSSVADEVSVIGTLSWR